MTLLIHFTSVEAHLSLLMPPFDFADMGHVFDKEETHW